MRIAKIALPLVALLLAFTASCESDAPNTLIRLIIDSDLEVGTELTKLEVRIFDRDGKEELRRQDFALGEKREGTRFALPLSIKLAPDSQRSSIDFRLVVTGIGPVGAGGGEVEVVEQQALVSFRPGEQLRLDIFLARSCLLKLCREDEDSLSSLTCDVETGACVEVPTQQDLPTVSGDGVRQYEEEKGDAGSTARDEAGAGEVEQSDLDAGDPLADASDEPDPLEDGSQMDASVTDAAALLDASALSDAGPSGNDSGVGTVVAQIGSACSAEAARACGGRNTTDALICDSGTWRLRTTCDGNNRCDARAGATLGTCQVIVSECVGRQPAARVCRGTERFACGDDLVSLIPVTCGPNAECYQGGCACVIGFVPNSARTQCAKADDPISVSVGSLGCALLKSGRVACWGAGRIQVPTLVADPAGSEPVTNAIDLSVAETSACAAQSDGRAICWGTDSYGIGVGGTPLQAVYVPRENGAPLGDVRQIAAGANHACAVTNAGGVFCWGVNNFRQLGTPSSATSVAYAEQVVGTNGTGTLGEVDQVVVGNIHTCARTRALGVLCWGANIAGQLGTSGSSSGVPALVPGLFGVTQLSASVASNSTCALAAGTVSCWGRNAEGQLGSGTVNLVVGTPSTVLVGANVPLAGIAEVTIGQNAACARSSTTVSCWGLNDHGQLGQPFTTTQSLYATVNSKVLNPVKLGQGSTYTNCIIDSQAQVICWGAGADYQLGDGTKQDSVEPRAVLLGWEAP